MFIFQSIYQPPADKFATAKDAAMAALKQGASKDEVVRSLKLAYIKTNDGLTSEAQKKQLKLEYLKATNEIDNYFFKPVEKEKPSEYAAQKQVEAKVRSIAAGYVYAVVAYVNPASLYSVEVGEHPAVKDIRNQFDELDKICGTDTKLKEYAMQKLSDYADSQFEAIMFSAVASRGTMRDYAANAYMELVRDSLKGAENLAAAKENMVNGLNTVVAAQSAIDGVSAVVKYAAFRGAGAESMDDGQLLFYFGRIFGKNDIASLKAEIGMGRGQSAKEYFKEPQNTLAFLDKLSGKFGALGSLAGFADLAFDVNYGENGRTLDLLLPKSQQGNGSRNGAFALYRAMLGSAGLAESFRSFANDYGDAATKLLNEKTYIYSQYYRGKYDLASIASFAYAYEHSKFMQDMPHGETLSGAVNQVQQYDKDGKPIAPMQQPQAKNVMMDFISAVGASDGYYYPPAVTSTILQNYRVLDNYYTTSGGNWETFNRQAGATAIALNTIYSQQMGGQFLSPETSVTLNGGRAEAAYAFMNALKIGSSTLYLDDMITRYLQTNQQDPHIALRMPQQMVSLVPTPADLNNIGKRMAEYMPRLPDNFYDMNAYRDAADRWLGTTAPEITLANPVQLSQVLGLLNVPETTNAIISAMLARMLAKKAWFRPNMVSVDAGTAGLVQADKRVSGNAAVGLTGPTGSLFGAYSGQQYTIRDRETGQPLYVDAYTNATLNASNLQLSGARIYNQQLQYFQETRQDIGAEKITNTTLLERLNAAAGSTSVVVEGDYQSYVDGDKVLNKDYRVNAYLYTNGGWYRLYRKDDYDNYGFSERMIGSYAEASVGYGMPFAVRAGYENRATTIQSSASIPVSGLTPADLAQRLSGLGVAGYTADDLNSIINLKPGESAGFVDVTGVKRVFASNGTDIQMATESNRNGFFVGIELPGVPKKGYRSAGLYVNTPDGNQAALVAAQVGETKENNAKIVSVGWFDMSKIETDQRLQPITDPTGRAYPLNVGGGTDQSGYMTTNSLFMGSYRVVDRFYSTLLLGNGIVGGMAASRRAGGGAVVQFHEAANGYAVDRYFLNGAASFEAGQAKTVASAFVNVDNANSSLQAGGAAKITLKTKSGEEVLIVVSGLVGDKYVDMSKMSYNDYQRWDSMLKDWKALQDDKATELQNAYWQSPTQGYGVKADKTADWTRRSLDLVARMRRIVPGEFINDPLSEISLGVKWGAYSGKIAVTKVVLNHPGDTATYLVTMQDVRIGKEGWNVSLTGAFQLDKKTAEPAGDGQFGDTTDVLGFKIQKMGKFALGFATYNLFSGQPGAVGGTVAYQFEGSNPLTAMLNLKLGTGGDGSYFVDFYLGNRKVKWQISLANAEGVAFTSTALRYDTFLGETLPFYVLGGIGLGSDRDFDFKRSSQTFWKGVIESGVNLPNTNITIGIKGEYVGGRGKYPGAGAGTSKYDNWSGMLTFKYRF